MPADRGEAFLRHLLGRLVAPGGCLILCGYGSPRSGVTPDPVCASARSFDFEPELEFDAEAPEGGGAILEVAVLRAG